MGDGAQPSLFTGAQPCASYCCCVTHDPNLGAQGSPSLAHGFGSGSSGRAQLRGSRQLRGLTRPEGGFFRGSPSTPPPPPPSLQLLQRVVLEAAGFRWQLLQETGNGCRLVEGCALDGLSFMSASAVGQSGVGAPSFQGCRERPPSWWKGESGPVTGEMGGEVLGRPSAVAAVASPPVWSVVSPPLQRAF